MAVHLDGMGFSIFRDSLILIENSHEVRFSKQPTTADKVNNQQLNFTTSDSWRSMSQIINLSDFNKSDQTDISTLDDYQYQDADITPIAVLTATDSLKLLREMFPNKLLFDIRETASLLNLSYEFIREKINSGQIPHTPMGNRKMINIITINQLIIEGI